MTSIKGFIMNLITLLAALVLISGFIILLSLFGPFDLSGNDKSNYSNTFVISIVLLPVILLPARSMIKEEFRKYRAFYLGNAIFILALVIACLFFLIKGAISYNSHEWDFDYLADGTLFLLCYYGIMAELFITWLVHAKRVNKRNAKKAEKNIELRS